MNLFEHPDFRDILIAAARDLGFREEFLEKDYHATSALRIAHETLGSDLVFKGGTSLSKGWKLIDRFSEDIDLLLIEGGRTNNAVNTDLSRLMRHIADYPPFTREPIKHLRGATVDAFSAVGGAGKFS